MIRGLARLFRLRLALLNGVTATAGVLLYPLPAAHGLFLSVFIGVVLLAAGGSALNQAQEYKLDRLMSRTRLRPVAQGDLSPAMATLLGAVAIMAGVFVIGASGGLMPALIGAGGILWYLAVYTPLKTCTSYALTAGALCGAMPPVIGWCSVGGSMLDYRIILLAGILYLWQIPHFWLLQQRHESDYRRAGIRLIRTDTVALNPGRLFWLWLVAFIAGVMLLPALHILEPPVALWYVAFPIPLVILTIVRSQNLLFVYLNSFPIVLALLLYFRA